MSYQEDLDLSQFDLFADGPKIPEGKSFGLSPTETASEAPGEEVTEETVSEQVATNEETVPEEPAETGYTLSKRALTLKKQEEKIANEVKQLEEWKAKVKSYEEAKASARANPIKALESLGLDWEYINDWLINGGEQPVEDKFEQLKAQIAEEKAAAERERVEGYKRALIDGIKAEPEKYELIQLHNAYEDVYELQLLWRETHKQDLPADKAADLVEEELLRREEEKIQKSTKLRNKFVPSQKTEAPKDTKEKETKPAKDIKPPQKSISNLGASSQSASTKKKHMSDDEAIELISKNFPLFG